MLELNMMTKKAVAAADNVSVAAVPHRAYLHMYNTAYARRNVRQRAQLILQRVLCAFFFCFCFERERAECHSHSGTQSPLAIEGCGHHAAAGL